MLYVILMALLSLVAFTVGIVLMFVGWRIHRADPKEYRSLQSFTRCGGKVSDREIERLLRIGDFLGK